MILRPYQEESLKSIEKSFKSGIHKQLVVLPTGSGKTIVFAALCKKIGGRALVLAHRDELLRQARDKIQSYWPEAETGFVNATEGQYKKQIVIGSVQSCKNKKRLESLKEQNFELLIIDEAHHATANSYRKIIDGLGFSFFKEKLLVGVTATPYRENHGTLGDVFQEVVYLKEIPELIEQGFLSPVIGRKIKTGIDLDSVKTTAGDFQQDQLAHVVDTINRNELIVEKVIEHAPQRKGLTFCVNIAHCKSMAAAYNKNGIKSLAIWGEMGHEERKKALKDFNKGKVQMLTSCGVLTEGFDEPSISCIVMARPTKSKTLYIQCAGRGLRPLEGKENCLILDISDSHHNLKAIIDIKTVLPQVTVITDKTKKEIKQEELEKLQAKEKVIADQEFEILGPTTKPPIDLMWIDIADNESCVLAHRYSQGKRAAEWEFVRRKLQDDRYSVTVYINNYDGKIDRHILERICSSQELDKEIAETTSQLDFNFSNKAAPWFIKAYTEQITDRQKELLINLKTTVDTKHLTKADATILINQTMAIKRKDQRRKTIPLQKP